MSLQTKDATVLADYNFAFYLTNKLSISGKNFTLKKTFLLPFISLLDESGKIIGKYKYKWYWPFSIYKGVLNLEGKKYYFHVSFLELNVNWTDSTGNKIVEIHSASGYSQDVRWGDSSNINQDTCILLTFAAIFIEHFFPKR